MQAGTDHAWYLLYTSRMVRPIVWQLAYASKGPLTPENYAAARAAMKSYRSDRGRVPSVAPNKLGVPPVLENAALHGSNTETKEGGGSNPWKNTADLIVTPIVAED